MILISSIFFNSFEIKTRLRVDVDDHEDLSLKSNLITTQFKDQHNPHNYTITGYWKVIDPFILNELRSFDYLELSKLSIKANEDSYSGLKSQANISDDISNSKVVKLSVKNIWMNDIMFTPVHLPEPGLWCISVPNKSKKKHYWFNSLDNSEYFEVSYSYNKTDENSQMLMTNRYLSRYYQYVMNVTNDEYTSHILIFVYGKRYEDLLKQSINSMIYNHTMYSRDQTIFVWIVRNYISEDSTNELKSTWNWTRSINHPTVWIDIKFTPFKWFQGLFDKYEPIASEIQLARVMFVNQLVPFEVKRVISKDADQIMQFGNILDFYRYDLSYEEQTDNPDINIPRLAVFGYVAYWTQSNEMYDDLRFWTSDNWRRYFNDKTYHFGALGLIDVKLYTHFNTNKGMIGMFNGLKWKRDAINCLDQDLINIYQINNKVVTVEGNWIWWETWCHEKLKKSAIFIDLWSVPSR